MKLKSVLVALFLSTTLTLGASPSSAQDSTLGKHTTPSGIAYVSGGIGDVRQEAMESMRKDYNFMLTFARPHSGDYLADVKVAVENTKSHEKIIDVISGGPMFFAQLPTGKYNVTVEFEGKQQVKAITIRKGHPREIVFYFVK